MRLIIFILLIKVCAIKCRSHEEEEHCPEFCKCTPDPIQPTSQQVTCNYSTSHISSTFSSSSPFREISTSLRSLIINCADDTSIRLSGAFLRKLTSLTRLKFNGCAIETVSPMIFDDCGASLRSLEIHEARLADLDEQVFRPLTRLEQFSMTNSKSQIVVPERLLCHLQHLQVLNLSSNTMPTLRRDEQCVAQQLLIVDVSRNLLSSVEQFLRGVPNLRQLSIAHNSLRKIESLSTSTPFLQQLDVEFNEIEEIVDELPETLVHVNFANNKMEQIPGVVLELAHLVAVNFSSNLLTSQNATAFKSRDIEMFDVSGNRLTELPEEWLAGCQNNLVHLKLEGNLIEKLTSFENFTNLQNLDLSSNLLETLPQKVFSSKNAKISSLILSNNSLVKIDASSFVGLKLDTLDLSANQLEDIPTAIQNVEHVKRVDLSRNRINKLSQNLLTNVRMLYSLNLAENQLQSIGPRVFGDCADLHTLDVSKNEISLIFKDAFANCPKLKKIVLKANRIQSIDEGLLEATSLKKLDISENRLIVLKWSALPENLEYLVADKNSINLLTAAGRMSIKTISLNDNQLSILSGEQIPSSVENLELARNRIQHITKSTFANKVQLRKVNLAANRISVLDGDAIRINGVVHPIRLNIQENPLECSCQMTWMLENYENDDEEVKNKNSAKVIVENRATTTCDHVIDKRVIHLDRVQKSDLLCQYQQVCEPECVCCQYGNCDCKSVCPASCRCFRDDQFKLNIVRCEQQQQRNATQDSPREFVVSELPVTATEITLTGVALPQLRTRSFIGRRKLQVLRINGTGLRSIQTKAFTSLTSLTTLDLSNNMLLGLTGDEFLNLDSVKQVFLNGNRLRSLSRAVLDRFPSLKFLTLHNNSFEDIPSVLSSVMSLSGISLSGNPLRCDCASSSRHVNVNRFAPPIVEHNAAEWMSHYRHLVVDASKVECVENVTKAFKTNDTTILSGYPPNVHNELFVMPIDEFLREYNVSICVPFSSGFFGQDPQNSIIFVAIAVALAILMCIAVIIAVQFIRKSHDAINQRRYKTSSSLNCSTSAGSSPLPVPLLSYHAFVSYSKRDEKMVIDQLCRPLEDDDYQLCLLHRDGPVYNLNLHAISDDLISQMDATQCLILVLTKNFLENEWKTLQIKTSHQLYSKNRAKRVIAVLGDDVDANLLDEELGQILRKHTRIDMKSHLFWTLLHSSLPSRAPLNHHSNSTDTSSQVYSDIYGIVPSDVV